MIHPDFHQFSVLVDDQILDLEATSVLSIHSPSSIHYYKDNLKADRFVMSTLEDFHRIPFSKDPEAYYEPNNKSAVKHATFLWNKMLEWEERGYCERTQTKPFCCNPITISEKTNLKTGKTKLRPCMDFSRHVNRLIPDQHVRISHLAEAEKLLELGDWQTSFDLENMYFHVRIHPDQWKFLGCEIESPSGEKLFFFFKVMIYGIKSAVHTVTKLTRPIVKKAALMGIRFSIMIDDGRVLGRTKEEARENLAKVLDIVKKSGWNINWEKSVTEPSQALYHQGMITCTAPLMYILPDFKIRKLQELIEDILNTYRKSLPVTSESLARMIGSVVSGQQALGPLSRILLRSSHILLATQTNNFQLWHSKFQVTNLVATELDMLNSSLPTLNGQPILLSHSGVTLHQLLKMTEPHPAEDPPPTTGPLEIEVPMLPFLLHTDPPEPPVEGMFRPPLPTEVVKDIIASDSSDFQEYAYSVRNPSLAFMQRMSHDVSEMSSGQRELQAVLNCVESNNNQLYSETPALIYWLTDSQNVCCWLEKGSNKPYIQSDVVNLVTLLSKLNLTIVPIHVPRDHSLLVLADCGSKFQDTDDWSIDDHSLHVLQHIAGQAITCDTFAYNTNARTAKFYSKIPSPGCAGINAFSMDWTRDFNFVCPPVKEITYVIQHIQTKPTQGILVVPSWPTAMFWNKITHDGSHLLPMFIQHHIFRPYVYKGQDCNSIFGGNLSFDMLGLIFDSSIESYKYPSSSYCINKNCSMCVKIA